MTRLVSACLHMLCVVLLSVSHAEEQKAQTPIEKFVTQSRFSTFMCRAETDIALMEGQLGKRPDLKKAFGCKDEHSPKLDEAYNMALKSTKTADVQSRIKDLYSETMAVLDALRPKEYDVGRRGYNGWRQRSDAEEQRLERIRNRLLLDAK